MDMLFLAGLALFLIYLYFLPGCVAAGRKHPQAVAIFALNFLLGWTFIGWAIALVWALMAIPQRAS